MWKRLGTLEVHGVDGATDGFLTDLASHIIGVVWALNFAGRLTASATTSAKQALSLIGRHLDASPVSSTSACASRGLRKLPRHNEPSVALDLQDRLVLFKLPGWEVDYGIDTVTDHGLKISRYLQTRLPDQCPIFWDTAHCYGLLHRLDIPSSGLLLVAKRYEAYYDLKLQLNAGALIRDYVVVCHGHLPSSLTEIDAPIHATPKSRNPSRGVPTGKPSRTLLKVQAHTSRGAEKFSLVAIRIITGRQHQIRVHMAHA